MSLNFIDNMDLLESKYHTILIPVNASGIVNNTLMKQFNRKYNKQFNKYLNHCKKDNMQVGATLYLPVSDDIRSDRHLLLVSVKQHWDDNVKYSAIKKTLDNLVKDYKNIPITSIAIPDFSFEEKKIKSKTVLKLLKNKLSDIIIDVEIYQNKG